MKQKLGKRELINQLTDQLEKIRDFAELYDTGKLSYAQEIAVKIRILFHNSNSSKSLLSQLKLDHIPFLDTAKKYYPNNILSHWGLIVATTTVGGGHDGSWIYQAPLNETSEIQMVSFQNWWDSKKIIVDSKKNIFTRRKIIQELADTDGGAHVDDALKKEYHELTKQNSLGWFQVDNWGTTKAMENPVPPSVRQIAYETLETFRNLDVEKESRLR